MYVYTYVCVFGGFYERTEILCNIFLLKQTVRTKKNQPVELHQQGQEVVMINGFGRKLKIIYEGNFETQLPSM